MASKVAILGTGVLARQLIRTIFDEYGMEIVLVTDISGQYATDSDLADDISYHLQYDTLYKRWKAHQASAHNDKLIIDGKEIPCKVDESIDNLTLGALDVDVLIDCSGKSDNGSIITGVWNAGGKCCIATTRPSLTALPNYYHNNIIVTPLNDIQHGQSAYLCDGNVVARSIISKIIDNNQVIDIAHYIVHKPNTNYMYVQDYPNGSANRNSRACDNVIYEGTPSSADLVGRIMPQLSGKCYTSTYRIVNKTMHSTLCDFTVRYSDTIEHVIGNIKGYSGDGYKYLLYDNQDTVSSDYENQDCIGLNDNCISMQQNGERVQVNMYYDAILLQVRNIVDYISSHNGDWGYNS